MSDENWYKDLTADELEGKHVHVEFRDWYAEGYLNCHGDCTCNGDETTFIPVLRREDKAWCLVDGVISVSLVWDERDWEKLFPDEDDIRNADAIVSGDNLLCVTDVGEDYFVVDDCNRIVRFSEITCALRYRYEFPSRFGVFKGRNCFLVLHNNEETLPWTVISDDYSASAFSNTKVARFNLYQYLPLTPVYFAEYSIPDKPGFYRGEDNAIYLKTPSLESPNNDEGWSRFSHDFSVIYDVRPEQIKECLPLTPLRFVDVEKTQES